MTRHTSWLGWSSQSTRHTGWRTSWWAWLGAFALLGCEAMEGGSTFVIRGHLPGDSGFGAQPKDVHGTGSPLITHVMVVNPESSAPERLSAQVASDGTFAVAVEPGTPYVLVFVDSTAVGAEMAVAIFRAGSLDTIAPLTSSGELDLGDVTIDPVTQTATMGIGYHELLASLGLTAAGAEHLGAIDDLSLRYANPDIDADGVLDTEQGRSFQLEFHVRSSMKRGSESGEVLRVADMTDRFFDTSGANAAVPVFNLTSIYAIYPESVDATEYVGFTDGLGSLQNGAAFAATLTNGSDVDHGTSFGGLTYDDHRGWGPDYSWDQDPTLDLPGATGSPATLVYSLGATGTTLTFTNVVTRTRASLMNVGMLVPLLRLNTDADGRIRSIDYAWKKRQSDGSWTDALDEEIALTVNNGGGYVSFHRVPDWDAEIGLSIPPQASGTLAWDAASTNVRNVTESDLLDTTPDHLCGVAVSYDDKLGLRLFVGGAEPNPGVSCQP